MRRVSAVVSAAVVMAASVMLIGGRLPLQASGAPAQTEVKPSAVGSWSLTFTPSSGGQTTPVLFTLHADGTLIAGELPVAAGALLPAPSELPAPSGAPASSEPLPSPSEASPIPTEQPAGATDVFNSPGQGVWNAAGDKGFAFTYLVLQSDQAGNFVAKVTVSGSATPDASGEAHGDYTMRFAGPDGQDLGSSSGTLEGDPIEQDLVAMFDITPKPGTLRVTFTDTSPGNPTDWHWDFGDGTNEGIGPHPTHTYAQPDDYTVFLTVSNDQGETSTTGEIITVGQQAALRADFSSSQTPNTLEISFSEESSGQPKGWGWDFGDGGSSTRPNPKHTYDKPGDYKVTLTVGNESSSDSATKTVTVVAPPTADFSTSQTPGSLQVQFNDQSTGGPAVWHWDFGDGRSGNKQNAVHSYRNPGTYQVTLVVFNGGGRDSTTKTVTVTSTPSETPSPSESASP